MRNTTFCHMGRLSAFLSALLLIAGCTLPDATGAPPVPPGEEQVDPVAPPPADTTTTTRVEKILIDPTSHTFATSSANSLLQITDSPPTRALNRLASATSQAYQVLDSTGNSVSVSSAVQVTANYVLFGGMKDSSSTSVEENVCLDTNTGLVVPLEKWPDNLGRIYATASTAFYVSGGAIYETDLSTGSAILVSAQGDYWQYTLSGYSNDTQTSWPSRTWIYVDPSSMLYAVNVDNFNNGYTQGMGARFIRTADSWVLDESFSQAFLPSMPAYVADEIPGSTLVNSRWLITDQTTSKLYETEMSGSNFSVYEYDLASWSAGSLGCTLVLSSPMSGATFLGFNNTIQNSILSDRYQILRISSSAGVLTVKQIAVPNTVPATSSINWPGGYVQYWPNGAVTNWKFLDGQILFLDPTTLEIHTWNLDPLSLPSSTPIGKRDDLKFLY